MTDQEIRAVMIEIGEAAVRHAQRLITERGGDGRDLLRVIDLLREHLL